MSSDRNHTLVQSHSTTFNPESQHTLLRRVPLHDRHEEPPSTARDFKPNGLSCSSRGSLRSGDGALLQVSGSDRAELRHRRVVQAATRGWARTDSR